jgi:hypothetical protein
MKTAGERLQRRVIPIEPADPRCGLRMGEIGYKISIGQAYYLLVVGLMRICKHPL